jgi:hypothetical protein
VEAPRNRHTCGRAVGLHQGVESQRISLLPGRIRHRQATAGRQPLDLSIATTSSESPGGEIDGHATRVGIAPGRAARLVMYWRGYSQAADTTTPQTLEVLLRPGVAAVPFEVPEPLFDLIDGGELRVGNWLPAV